MNAQANVLKGMGYELTNSDYQNCVIEFYNIANIHVMRDSLKKIKKMCETLPSLDSENFAKELENTGWLEHIRRVYLFM